MVTGFNRLLAGAALLLACLLAAASIVRESRASRAAQLNSENYAAAARIKEAEALLAEARARRIAGSFLDRDAAGEAAIRSWQLHRSPEARDELLSILAMPGLSAGGAPLRTSGSTVMALPSGNSNRVGAVISGFKLPKRTFSPVCFRMSWSLATFCR